VSITLTEKEDLLRRFLLDCAERLPVELRPELRFAGGWVRDKLLELPSHDIDVALSSMTGAEFGKHLQEFSSKHGNRYESEAAALGISAQLRSLNYIAENPEKSKHLATMTTKFLGFDLDFANLRKETYSDTSRNPEMEFGTSMHFSTTYAHKKLRTSRHEAYLTWTKRSLAHPLNHIRPSRMIRFEYSASFVSQANMSSRLTQRR
jgi:hypothetical protein